MGSIGDIATEVLPLYGVILLAWTFGRRVPWLARLLSTVLVYALIPILVLGKVEQAEAAQIAVITPMVFAIAAAMSLPAWWLARRSDDVDPRLLSASFSFFNVAFFGVPVAGALFGPEGVATIICAYIGSALYGDTIGYYLIARGEVGRFKAATKALGVPMVYAFAVALVLKATGTALPAVVADLQAPVGVLVSVLGMAVIGLNLSEARPEDVAARSVIRILAVRQTAAVILFAAALAAEAAFVGVLDGQARALVGIVALFPVAANISLFATLLDRNRREAAVLVGASSFLSLALVVLAVALVGPSIGKAG